MKAEARPISKKKRLEWIDAARGFAVFGILVVNIGSFSAPFFMYGGEDLYWKEPIDKAALTMIDILFQASFYSLFSILFGFGMQMMKENLLRKNMHPTSILIRRLIGLIGFGVIHTFLLWHGDILLTYGVIGLLLLFFLRQSNRMILIWSVLLFGGGTLLFTTLLYSMRDYLDTPQKPMIEQAMENYQSENLFVIWSQNYADWTANNGVFSYIILTMMLLPLFLIGIYIARKRWLHEPAKYKKTLLRAWVLLFILFISFKAGPYVFDNPAWFSLIQDNIGGAASALFYIVSVTLLALTTVGQRLLAPFAAVGRMAFTNYIGQSVISIILFYGVGLGLYGSVTPIEGVLLAVGIFIVQILFSKWWLNRFRYGPLEWLWRCFTYGKRQPFKIAKERVGNK